MNEEFTLNEEQIKKLFNKALLYEAKEKYINCDEEEYIQNQTIHIETIRVIEMLGLYDKYIEYRSDLNVKRIFNVLTTAYDKQNNNTDSLFYGSVDCSVLMEVASLLA